MLIPFGSLLLKPLLRRFCTIRTVRKRKKNKKFTGKVAFPNVKKTGAVLIATLSSSRLFPVEKKGWSSALMG
jgi:hypothetical protein